MIKSEEGNVDIRGIQAEILGDLSVIVSTLKTHTDIPVSTIMQAVGMGLEDDHEELSPEQQHEVESWLKAEREKAKGGMKYGN